MWDKEAQGYRLTFSQEWQRMSVRTPRWNRQSAQRLNIRVTWPRVAGAMIYCLLTI